MNHNTDVTIQAAANEQGLAKPDVSSITSSRIVGSVPGPIDGVGPGEEHVELIGTYQDSSGLYRIFREGDTIVTSNGPDEARLDEIGRQSLTPAINFGTTSEDDWTPMGTNGHDCDIHVEGDYARIDSVIFQLADAD